MSLVLCLDFDGSLVERNEPLRWRPGAKEAIVAFAQAGHRLILHSARSTPPETFDPDNEREAFYARGVLPEAVLDFWERFDAMRAFLVAEGVMGLLEVWDAPGKPIADAYIDDRSDAPDWPRLVGELVGTVESSS